MRLATAAFALLFALPAFAQLTPEPNFAAHSAGPAYTGPTHQPDFISADRAFAQFRTRLTNAAREQPNFAGKYLILQIGCGTGCNTAYVIDKSTGHVMEFPRGGERNGELALKYTVTSRLIIAEWRADDDRCRTEEFVLRDGKFARLREAVRPGPGCSPNPR